jgi:hypothetical protein
MESISDGARRAQSTRLKRCPVVEAAAEVSLGS